MSERSSSSFMSVIIENCVISDALFISLDLLKFLLNKTGLVVLVLSVETA